MRKMFSWKVVYGWIDKITKKRERENTIYLWIAVYQHKKLRDVHAAYVRYHHDCWLDVTKIQASKYEVGAVKLV